MLMSVICIMLVMFKFYELATYCNDRLIQEYIVREALSVLVFIVISSELLAEQHCGGVFAMIAMQNN